MSDPDPDKRNALPQTPIETQVPKAVGQGDLTQGPASPDETPPDDLPPVELPSVETITLNTDLAPYLKPGIPAAIRNAALRRKWLLNPVIRDYVDPALDYAWDWNAAAGVPGAGGRIAVESVARMLRDVVGRPPDEREDDAPQAPAVGQTAPDSTPQAVAEQASTTATSPGDVKPFPPDPESDPEPGTPVVRRRHGGATPS